ncbi:P-loop NTPase fold protein [Peptococcus simiae]|uniref:P-loop NTPase fold protein n=1 Tax=Peptococcus simiae TaxID=1643805 RepID=UPI00397EFE41
MYEQIVTLIDSEMRYKKKFVLAIDGMAGSGKTTLAHILQENYSEKANLISMDDFYLPAEDAFMHNNYADHINVKMFLQSILNPLSFHQDITYKPFLCKLQKYGTSITLTSKPICIIEGTYSCLPIFEQFYNLKICLITSKHQQEQRLLKREGEINIKKFDEIWLPRERTYFSETSIFKRMDFIMRT